MSKWKKVALWKKILIGVVIGLIIGLVSPKAAEVISPLGDIFLRMLKMLIVPLVFFSITSGVCKMGDVKQLRTVGIRYVLWIMASAVIAAICGVIGGLIVQPGRGTTEFLAAAEAAEAQSYSFIDNVISWFPTNIVESMANANMLQIIVFCLFLGVALLALGDKAKTVIRFIDEGSEVMLKITEYVIEFSPFGILSLIATMVSTISGAMMKEVLVFLITDNVICLLILILVYPLIIKLLAKLPPFGFMRKIAPAILAAKNRYFWCIDNQEFDLMPDVFTETGFRTFWSGRPGFRDRDAQVAQNRSTCGDDMVPMHFGYNQIVHFTGPRSAQLLTKMHDYHTYKDNGQTYSGYGLYVDDLVKCDDDRWRIQTLRLTYRLLDGKLRRTK